MPEATVRLPIAGLGSTDFRVGERVFADPEKRDDEAETFTVRAPTGYRVIVGVPATHLTIDQ